ncbi:MAG: hypothetical protein IKG01_10030 [Lachnospiraceae bacterium]|nr:hypothetical protein [Lachnospiraceae bacterium]
MVKIEFYWDDLTENKQREILDKLGENCNWDVFPFCTMEIEESEDG